MKNLIGFAIALSVFGADKAKTPEPNYDPATMITIAAKVTDVREIPNGQAMAGVHILLQKDSQTLDIYVGPSEFVKIFDVKFAKGDDVQLIGSKVDFEGATVVLAREVTLGKVTLLCRDKDGEPLWKYFLKPPVG